MPLAIVVLVLAASGAAGAEGSIELGGLRRASAHVRRIGPDYRIDVRMTPITAFDESTNRAMNLEIARACALKALARHLSKKRLVVSGARILTPRSAGGSFQMTLQVAADQVKIVDADVPPERRPDQLLGDDCVFTRKAEYEQTILHLERILTGELQRLISKRKMHPEGGGPAQLKSLGKKMDADFERMAKYIRSDLELSTLGSTLDPDDQSERDQLLAQLARSRRRLRARLDEILKTLPREEKP
jgi:hypothetical protein